jgi:hypothetical protein
VNRILASALFILASLAPPIIPATAGDQVADHPAEMTGSWKKDPVRRLQPDDAGVPAEFAEKLSARGCTIPQYDGIQAMDAPRTGASNVIHGEFARHGQEDWAVLCSHGRSSTIVIFWGKPTACPASLARLDDAHYLKRMIDPRDKTLHYWREIRALGEQELDNRPGLSGLKPLKHQGIDDRFVGKSSAFFYCDAGKWRIFPAKDVTVGAHSPPKD